MTDYRVTLEHNGLHDAARYVIRESTRANAEADALERFTDDDTPTEYANARIVQTEYRTRADNPWRICTWPRARASQGSR